MTIIFFCSPETLKYGWVHTMVDTAESGLLDLCALNTGVELSHVQ